MVAKRRVCELITRKSGNLLLLVLVHNIGEKEMKQVRKDMRKNA